MNLLEPLFKASRLQTPGQTTGHILGVRTWRLDRINSVLRSRYFAYMWPIREAAVSHSRDCKLDSKNHVPIKTDGAPKSVWRHDATLNQQVLVQESINCTCGFYACKPHWMMQDELDLSVPEAWGSISWLMGFGSLKDGRLFEPNVYCVAGLVALWGQVVEHENGYRAQYAMPLHILLHDELGRQELEDNYRITTEVISDRDQYMQRLVKVCQEMQKPQKDTDS